MFRVSLPFRTPLPFEPMALITVDKLEFKMQSYEVEKGKPSPSSTVASNTSATRDILSSIENRKQKTQQQLHWFTGEVPFFISPKLDGVRLLTYVPPTNLFSSEKASKGKKSKKESPPSSASPTTLPQTCYSRYGRPISGLFWIEKELMLLRTLCRDSFLCLDGELYIHRQVAEEEKETINLSNERVNRRKEFRSKNRTLEAAKETEKGVKRSDTNTGSKDAFKTGFIAVSSLVHRLRGTKTTLGNKEEVYQYVNSLPRYCVFDVPAYSPGSNILALLSKRSTPQDFLQSEQVIAVHRECGKIWRDTLEECGVKDMEELKVLPNHTPFTQRLRTLHFLFTLLQKGVASPILREHFQLESEETPSPSGPTGKTGRGKRGNSTVKGPSSEAPSYLGGDFVQRIPYQLARNINEAKTVYLPRYTSAHYEGAVLRTPMNLYEMREKRKGTVRALGSSNIYRLVHQGSKASTRKTAQEKEEEEDTRESLQQVSASVAQLSQLSRRCDTAVKVLPFKDKEFMVLRALFKEPSVNPRTRQLLTVSMREAQLNSLDEVRADPVQPSLHEGKEKEIEAIRRRYPKNPKKADAAIKKLIEKVPVCFYGLQCMTDSGRVFNVTLPKLNLPQQEALLRHTLSQGRRRRTKGGATDTAHGKKKEGSARSLTGLYVTVQFASLTEHGVPRFAQIKSIRGGKGWFL